MSDFTTWFQNQLTVERYPMPGEIARLPVGSHVLNVSDEYIRSCAQVALDKGIYYHWLPLSECVGQMGLNSLFGALVLLHEAEQANRRVLLHCFLPGTLVGKDLPIAIERVDGEVIAHDGKLHPVVQRFERDYCGDVVQVDAIGTLPLTMTPNHKLLILRPYRFPNGKAAKPGHYDRVAPVVAWYQQEPQWVRADEIEPGDYLLSAKWTPKPENIDPEVAWALGFFAADGNVDENGFQYTLSLKDDYERLTRALAKLGYKAYVQVETETWRRLRVNSRAGARQFEEWFGRGSENKHLPAWLMKADPATVVAGVMAGDGHVLKNKTGSRVLTSVSQVLIYQVWQLLLVQGLKPYMRTRERYSGYPNAKQTYLVEWNPIGAHSKTTWWTAPDGTSYYVMPVKRTSTRHYEGKVHNFEVEDKHSYHVQGITVSNCHAGVNRSQTVAEAYYFLRTDEHLVRYYSPRVHVNFQPMLEGEFDESRERPNQLKQNCEEDQLPSLAFTEQFLRRLGEELERTKDSVANRGNLLTSLKHELNLQ